MFHMSWFHPYTGPIATLRFRRCPHYPLGIHTDVDGVAWDVHGVIGKHILARRTESAPDYYSTSAYADSSGVHEWIPYAWEVVDA